MKQYRPGDRIELISMYAPYRKIEPETRGMVKDLDDRNNLCKVG